MKIAIISCFDAYDIRLKHVVKQYEDQGHSCRIFMSDFKNFDKKYRNQSERRKDIHYLHAKRYSKNFSLARIYSHFLWARTVYKQMLIYKPDIIYALIPPNSVGKYMSKYKKKYNCKLIFDIIDMWPEAFSGKKSVLKLPFYFWRRLRNNTLKFADEVYTECELYQEILQKQGVDCSGFITRYIKGEALRADRRYTPDADMLNICYLGSINNVIDIPKIIRILEAINCLKPVRLNIIGGGETKQDLISEVSDRQIEVIDFGIMYESQRKQDIMNRCEFALNIMKKSVVVGLTIKSIDYMWAGVPLINNIKHDTACLVEKYNIGFNVTDDNIAQIAADIVSLSNDEMQKMRNNVTRCYTENFL